MKRTELEMAIQRACEVVKQDNVYIIGSQSILGSWSEEDLPDVVTLSDEVDIAPLTDDEAELAATWLDGHLGEMSEFHRANGFYVQGVGKRTANLPKGWRDRLVPVVPPGSPGTTGLCLDPHDLCASKLIANREKDLAFVGALLDADVINGRVLRSRVDDLDPDGVSGTGLRGARMWAKHAAQQQAARRTAAD